MDWTKAKTILIFALLATNLFLIFTYGVDRGRTEEYGGNEAVIKLLEEKHIFVEPEIPENHPAMPTLTVNHIDVPREDVEAMLLQEISAENHTEEAYIAAAEEFISYLGMMSRYGTAPLVRDEGEYKIVRFHCAINGFAVENSYMECTFSDRLIVDFQSLWLEPAGFSQKKKETVSASVALLTFMSQRERAQEIHVEGIDMVYRINEDFYESHTAVTDTALPAWRITLEGGEVIYIDAFER